MRNILLIRVVIKKKGNREALTNIKKKTNKKLRKFSVY